MSNGTGGKPKTVVFKPKSPAGGLGAEKTPSHPVPGKVTPLSIAEQPVRPAAVPRAGPPAAPVQVSGLKQPEPAAAQPDAVSPSPGPSAEMHAPKKDPERPRSRKFTLKRPADGKKPDAAVQTPAAPGAAAAEAGPQPVAKAMVRFGRSGAAPVPAVVSAQPGAAEVVKASAPRKPSKSYAAGVAMLFILTVCLGAISFLGFWLAVRGTTAARFGNTVGRIEVHSGKYMRIARSLMRVLSGDVISVTPGSVAYVMFNDIDSMQLYENTLLSMRAQKNERPNQPGGKLVVLEKGTIDFNIVSPAQRVDVSVQTTNAVVRCSAGRFLLVFTNECTELYVREGSIPISQRGGDKKTAEVQAGCWVAVSDQMPPAPASISGDTCIEDLHLVQAVGGMAVEGFGSPLKSEVILDRNKVVDLLGVRATTEPSRVGSVKFEMQGCPDVIVNEPPYVFKGKPDAGIGDGWKPEKGEYTLAVTPYSRKDCKGKRGVPKSVLFKVKGGVDY